MRRKALVSVNVTATVLVLGFAFQPLPTAAGPYDVEDNIMGEYIGTYQEGFGDPVSAEAKVIAWGQNKAGDVQYRIVIHAKEKQIEIDGKLVGEQKVEIADKGWTGEIADGKLTGKTDGPPAGKFLFKRAPARRSPTLGQKPRDNAVVLLPFGEGKEVNLDAWKNKNWLLADGGMQVNKGGQFTNQEFGDCRLHVEFRTPYEPDKRGQGRGNSGVYLQGRYEVQVLDSFGLKPEMGDCGSIYGVSITSKNMSLPPMQWQTYDILFRAPRFDANGNVTEKPRMKVRHNGEQIHDWTEIPNPTTAAPLKGHEPKGPLFLQDHGNPVQYRNVWLVEAEQK